MYQKIGILVVLASVLLSAALIATPTFKVANAQVNQTKGVDADQWIKVLKENHPTLAAIEQDPNVKDAIGKIKAMKDPQEAVKNLDALYALQQIMDLKTLQEAQ